jgi:hypothetical protein
MMTLIILGPATALSSAVNNRMVILVTRHDRESHFGIEKGYKRGPELHCSVVP